MRELYILSKRIWLSCHELDIDPPEEVLEVLAEVLDSEIQQKMNKGKTGFVEPKKYDVALYNFVDNYIDNHKTKTISDAIRKYIRDNNKSLNFESVKKKYFRQMKKGPEILNEVLPLD